MFGFHSIIKNRCQRFATESTATVANQCKVNVAEPTCAAIQCNGFVSGWNNNICEQVTIKFFETK